MEVISFMGYSINKCGADKNVHTPATYNIQHTTYSKQKYLQLQQTGVVDITDCNGNSR